MTDAGAGPIRVLHVMNSIGLGGLENGVANLVRHSSGGFRHEVLSFHRFEEGDPIGRNASFPAGTPLQLLWRGSVSSLRFLWRVSRLLKRLAPDVIHARNWAGIDGVLAARLAGQRQVVMGEHGWSPDDPQGLDPWRGRVRRFASRYVCEYTCVSRDIVTWLRQQIGIRKPITQIYNGVDTDRFQPGGARERIRRELGVGPEDFLVGSVGRLDPIKDYGTLIRAVQSLPSLGREVQLRIAGYGSEETALRALCTDPSSLLGVRTDAPDLLRAFDLFVLPSINEGISNTILEAMASGLPVVATRVGGTPEIVQPGVTGTLVEPSAVDPLRAAIAGYIQDPERCAREGAAARRIALERFSIARMVAEYEAVWARVHAAGRGSR
ncbi:MAG: glycosyltransferase [Planctomycetaceae bacterium]